MTALFGNTSALPSSKNLVEFRAGKMNLRGTTVTADKRKGFVYIYQSDDSLMHFCWKDRTSGTIEDDLIIFPDDIEFKRLSQCTTGRAYILKFKSSSRKFFFWMQEPKEDKDEEFCKKVNELLNNPPAPGSASSGGGGSGSGGLAGLQPALAQLGDQLGDSSLQSLLNNMDQNQLMQLLGMTGLGGAGGAGGFDSDDSRSSSRNTTAASTRESAAAPATVSATPAPAAASVPPASNPTPAATSAPSGTAKSAGAVQLSDLQNILSNMQVPQAAAQQESVDLAASFSTEALLPLLKDKEVQTRLKPFLPAAGGLPADDEELRNTVQSPQFKQALSVFSAALQSGQLAPLMQQFKLSQDAVNAAAKGDIIAFTKALQESESKATEEEDMALD
ncbi:proteasomal ubiquitin receptor ADRM1-like [Hydractinia symbiolongicarpus]|uniref:proteasomal ubiquitin receptor ADRM1-like n=1 Tax=Hydractinia symbiolongicarpus TaxID=13093 RepID=UPI00254AA668|nr:proteasomal ubiquitin receptor ADRM1-like [Hydractinia symbiolongicarpus]